MAGHEEMADDEFTVFMGPEEVLFDNVAIMGNFREARGASVIAEFEVGEPDVEHADEQRAGLGRAVGVGFPNEPGVRRHGSNEFERGGEVNGRFAAEQHDGARALAQSVAGFGGNRGSVEGLAGAGVPTGFASDAKSATEITTTEGDGEGGDEFKFVGDFGLRGKKTG